MTDLTNGLGTLKEAWSLGLSACSWTGSARSGDIPAAAAAAAAAASGDKPACSAGESEVGGDQELVLLTDTSRGEAVSDRGLFRARVMSWPMVCTLDLPGSEADLPAA